MTYCIFRYSVLRDIVRVKLIQKNGFFNCVTNFIIGSHCRCHIFCLGTDELSFVVVVVSCDNEFSQSIWLFLSDSLTETILKSSGKNDSLGQGCGEDAFLCQLKLGFHFPLTGSRLEENGAIIISFGNQGSS
ncbi:hypothetical protein [Parabacteroides goldsteinii]|uniref:hypothetical protein n=1 Tax=Parabacteroides goldsteinii TaxID=328812 RepID=UPI00266EE801|nr:hypothetical protein [Parabacteroides goldsteinii]